MTDFEKKYVSANNEPDAPDYDREYFLQLRTKLGASDVAIEPFVYPLFAALAIGAHRPDVVPKLFDEYIRDTEDEKSVLKAFHQFRGVLMIVWAFVGIPWCVPACLGLVHVLKSKGLAHLAEGRSRPDISVKDRTAGMELLDKTYAGVQNGEVRDMLRTYFADFSSLTWTVVFGYSLAGTTETGIFPQPISQLILAAAITSSGATRQARSHLKASLGLGNSVAAVGALHEAATQVAAWNRSTIVPLDVEQISREVEEALAGVV